MLYIIFQHTFWCSFMFFHATFFIKMEEKTAAWTEVLQRYVTWYLKTSTCHLLFKFCDGMDRIGKMILWFLSEVTKHKALCDYWMGGTLQMMFGVEEKPWIWQPCFELRLIFRVKLLLCYCYFNFNSPKFTRRFLHTQYEWDIIGCFWTLDNDR